MKTIKESLHDIIFRSIVVEAKASYDKFDMTFDEFCSDKANLELKDKEITGIEKGIKDLEAKKAQLQELKKAQAEEDSFKYVNSEK